MKITYEYSLPWLLAHLTDSERSTIDETMSAHKFMILADKFLREVRYLPTDDILVMCTNRDLITYANGENVKEVSPVMELEKLRLDSHLWHVKSELTPKRWEVASVEGDAAQLVILPANGDNGFMVGERVNLIQLRDDLTRFIESGCKASQTIGAYSPRLGVDQMTVSEASREFGVPRETVKSWARKMEGLNVVDGRYQMPRPRVIAYVNAWKQRKGGK